MLDIFDLAKLLEKEFNCKFEPHSSNSKYSIKLFKVDKIPANLWLCTDNPRTTFKNLIKNPNITISSNINNFPIGLVKLLYLFGDYKTVLLKSHIWTGFFIEKYATIVWVTRC